MIKTLAVFMLLLVALAFAAPVLAQGLVPASCQGANAATGCKLSALKDLIGYMINFLLGMAGAVTLLFLVWGGIQMLISGGNPEQIKKGKATVTNSLLGLAIVLGSYLIINLVINFLSNGKFTGLDDLLKFW